MLMPPFDDPKNYRFKNLMDIINGMHLYYQAGHVGVRSQKAC
jgi:hypothetical protein